ncbi:hypothetical protein D9615_004986 [Tricholomella constricta]|uniref:BTB domain-containing protein n=1 Tax=Tricholomella constricta TaxID=117010 RepID=A0A8H5M6R7_9AGAR|nr:hypothetical protein D9615_004986 [Tricholomella constricta]
MEDGPRKLPTWTPKVEEDHVSDKESSASDIDELGSQGASAAEMGNAPSNYDKARLSAAIDAISDSAATSPQNSPSEPRDAPPATPQPFPLSPPRPSQPLDTSTLCHPSPEASNQSDSDHSLPALDEMFAQTQPNYSPSQSSAHESNNSFDRNSMDIDPGSASTPKREMSSPIIPRSQSPKPTRKLKSKTKDVVSYIEILSSTEDEQPSSAKIAVRPKSTPRSSRSYLSTPSQNSKQKRTRSPITSLSTLHASDPHRRPPRKRAKVDAYTKSLEHWRLDGSVLIQIQGVRFRLHQSTLMRHGAWFKHTFNREDDPPELDPKCVGNLSLYHLCPDEMGLDARDFEILLDTIDNAIGYASGTIMPAFSTLASLLRASSGLGFTEFEKYAVCCLKAMWSPDLADLTPEPIPHATETVVLARKYAHFDILKRPLYELVRLEDFGRSDFRRAQARGDHSMTSAHPGPPTLTMLDMDVLIHARDQLTIVWTAALAFKKYPPCAAPIPGVSAAAVHPQPTAPAAADGGGGEDPDTQNPKACTGASHSLARDAHDRIIEATNLPNRFRNDPVCGLLALAEAPWAEEGFCAQCVQQRRQVWLDERERVWGALDGWFGL